ncbi:MAG: hypothetical protein VX777_03875 [Chlamydiota bacterium]|nr:hypothetical protein [Chlamydiota bacterium]
MLKTLFRIKNLILFSLLILTSCNKNLLRVQVDYISKESLASYHVGTPDPRLIYPPVGQRMIISWLIPKQHFDTNDITIKVTMHFGDHSIDTLNITPKNAMGMYVYCLLNDRYYDKCGFLTYKAEVCCNGMVIEKWQHHLWTELITFDENS